MANEYEARQWAEELLGRKGLKALTRQERFWLRAKAGSPHIDEQDTDLIAVLHTRAEVNNWRVPRLAGPIFEELRARVGRGDDGEFAIWAG